MLVTVHQVHSADTVTVTAPIPEDARPSADAMVTDRPGLLLGILTADCVPVLFADREAGVIGAAHAGWKGALGGVTDSVLTAMEKLGARREHITRKSVVEGKRGSIRLGVGGCRSHKK